MSQPIGPALVVGYSVVAGIVGLALARLSSPTRQIPERYVAAALIFGGTLGYPFTIFAVTIPHAPETALKLVVLGTIGLHLSSWFNVVAWRLTFHHDSFAARNIAIVLTLGLVVSCVDTIANHATWISNIFRPSSLTMQTCDLLIQMMPYVLTASAALRSALGMGRRVPLGLADATVVNRLWMWGFATLLVVAQFVIAIATLLKFAETSASHPATSIAIASLGIALTGLLALAFVPPRSYTRWIEHRAQRARAAA